MKASNSYLNLPTFLPKLALAAEFFNVNPLLQKSVYLLNLAANLVPSYLPIGKKTHNPALTKQAVKIQAFIDEISEKLGHSKGFIEVRLTDTFAQKVSYLGSKYSFGSRLLFINKSLLNNLENEDLLKSPIYQEWVKKLDETPNTPFELGEYLDNLNFQQRDRFFALFYRFKDIYSENEVKHLILRELEHIEANDMPNELNLPTLLLTIYQAAGWIGGLGIGFCKIFNFLPRGLLEFPAYSLIYLKVLIASIATTLLTAPRFYNYKEGLCQLDEQAALGNITNCKKDLLKHLIKNPKGYPKAYSAQVLSAKNMPLKKLKETPVRPISPLIEISNLAKAQYLYEKAVSKEIEQKMMPSNSKILNGFSLYSHSRFWIDYSPITDSLYNLIVHSVINLVHS